jgi:C_GCAxxG_C_C family probable redox protein
MGETCGAVTSALMIIGLKHGRFRQEDKDAQKKTYELTGRFIEKFKSRQRGGSILCRDLLGMDIKAPGAVKIAKEICPKYIKDAVEILEEMI